MLRRFCLILLRQKGYFLMLKARWPKKSGQNGASNMCTVSRVHFKKGKRQFLDRFFDFKIGRDQKTSKLCLRFSDYRGKVQHDGDALFLLTRVDSRRYLGLRITPQVWWILPRPLWRGRQLRQAKVGHWQRNRFIPPARNHSVTTEQWSL